MLNELIQWPVVVVGVILLSLSSRVAHSQSSQPDQQAEPQQQALTTPPDPNRSLLTPLKAQVQNAPYDAITPRDRVRWIVTNSIGPAHLLGGIFSAGSGTALDRPEEYGPHWQGFGERYGMRLTSIVPGNIMEAEIGAVWGEDPRYFRVPDEGFGGRVKNIVKQTFEARHSDGTFAPAYGRFVALPASNFLSNTWRPESEANNRDAILRSLEGLAGRMVGNAFEEFWPDVRERVFHKNN